MKTLPSGRKLLEARPDQARRYVLAALAQVQHWERGVAFSERGPLASAVIRTLMRRALPFERDDLLAILRYEGSPSRCSYFPPDRIAKAMERCASDSTFDAELNSAVMKFARRLRESRRQESQAIRHGRGTTLHRGSRKRSSRKRDPR